VTSQEEKFCTSCNRASNGISQHQLLSRLGALGIDLPIKIEPETQEKKV